MGFLLFLAFGAGMFALRHVTMPGCPAPELQATLTAVKTSLNDRLSQSIAEAQTLSEQISKSRVGMPRGHRRGAPHKHPPV
jgi:hypothetical protein